jgi:putative aldouronate transport system permease protein
MDLTVATRAVPTPRARARRRSVLEEWRREWVTLLLVLPGVVYFLVFHYIPLLGYIIAFEDYLPFLGFFASPWVGLQNFASLFGDRNFWAAVQNTLLFAFLQLFLFFPAPIALALLLNSVLSSRWRRLVQSVVYMPHFLSWVIIVALFQQMLGGSGLAASWSRGFGIQNFNVMSDPELFKWLITGELIWKETGWGTIIYLAALLSIDVSLYEAAAVDGAGPWARLWHVTLPGLLGVTILLLILRLGQILSVGFEQILLQREFVGAPAAEVMDTYVYFRGVVGGQWGVTAAAGMIKGIVGAALVISANALAHRFGQPGIFR